MSQKKKNLDPNDYETSREKQKSRGTQDDLEVLKLVISDNRGLQTRVLDRIRTILTQSSKYGEEFQKKNQNTKKEVKKVS